MYVLRLDLYLQSLKRAKMAGVSSAEYHSLHRVGAAVYIFMGEGGPTLATTADV